jgi:hypothetical protein
MQEKLYPGDLPLLERSKKEELESNFYHWLQHHFDVQDIQYLNLMIDELDEKTFLKIAEQWAANTIENKVYY